ncbi:MAG: hypothetical protein R3F59_15630 [Myxococcota bacterium]
MLRLTLRSGRDGRLLARIVERDGVLFVLDFGDPVVLRDASRRALHAGFTVEWQGHQQTATPSHPHLLRHLALHYAAQGLLVFVDEPDYPRAAPVALSLAEEAVPRPVPLSLNPATLLPDEPGDYDSNTVLRSRRELRELQDKLDATLNTGPQLPFAVVEVEPTLYGELVYDEEDAPPPRAAKPPPPPPRASPPPPPPPPRPADDEPPTEEVSRVEPD